MVLYERLAIFIEENNAKSREGETSEQREQQWERRERDRARRAESPHETRLCNGLS